MKITDIMNLSLEDLRKNQAKLIEEATGMDGAEIAKRFILTLIDAKRRDDLLGAQGRTLNALNDSLDEVGSKNKLVKIENEGLIERSLGLSQVNESIQDELRIERLRSARLKTFAECHGEALTSIMKISTDAINQHAIEEASR